MLPRNRSYGDSKISSLNLGADSHLPEAVLSEILRYLESLRRLVTSLPGRGLSDDPFRQGADLAMPLSPEAFSKALDATKSSLTELSLVDMDYVWPSHDGSRSDLRNFPSLKKLQISLLCYLLPEVSKRGGIDSLLPSSIEELEVYRFVSRSMNHSPLTDTIDSIRSRQRNLSTA